MTEVLAIASGVAGLLSLTIQVYQTTATYVDTVQRAPKAVKVLLQELQSLEQGLRDLTELSESTHEKDPGTQTRLSRMLSSESAEQYRSALKTLNHDLKKRTPGKSKRSRLMWPISEERVRRDLDILQRYHETIHRALQIDTL